MENCTVVHLINLTYKEMSQIKVLKFQMGHMYSVINSVINLIVNENTKKSYKSHVYRKFKKLTILQHKYPYIFI